MQLSTEQNIEQQREHLERLDRFVESAEAHFRAVKEERDEVRAELSVTSEGAVGGMSVEQIAEILQNKDWQIRDDGKFEYEAGVLLLEYAPGVYSEVLYGGCGEEAPLMAVQRHGPENSGHGLYLFVEGLASPEEAVRLLQRHGTDPAEHCEPTAVLATGEVR